MADEKQPDQMCRHIAVIMDGNGRWAKQRGKIRSFGHKEGLKAEILQKKPYPAAVHR